MDDEPKIPHKDRAEPAECGAEPSSERLHPAEHRAYRELYAASRQLLSRWGRLSDALADTPMAATLDEAAARVEDLLEALPEKTAEYGLSGWPAAQGVGARLGELRSGLLDRTADTGMVLRLAVLDIEHIATLLSHLSELASTRGDDDLAAFCRKWQRLIRPQVREVRRAAIALGTNPDRAAAPLDASTLGQVVHRAGWVMGTVGEWVDRQVAGRHDPAPGSDD
ncbi:MAG: hypothetical protein EXQ70_02780 [Solirubrobacterales bacterium]|nr:hypothetical protein [Solirubrobacterales bacterium]